MCVHTPDPDIHDILTMVVSLQYPVQVYCRYHSRMCGLVPGYTDVLHARTGINKYIFNVEFFMFMSLYVCVYVRLYNVFLKGNPTSYLNPTSSFLASFVIVALNLGRLNNTTFVCTHTCTLVLVLEGLFVHIHVTFFKQTNIHNQHPFNVMRQCVAI